MRFNRGITGTLVPNGYFDREFPSHALELGLTTAASDTLKSVRKTWRFVEARCGPATGLRTLYDLLADPLFSALGFRARDLSFGRGDARAVLVTPEHERVGLVLLPWATSPSSAARDVHRHAREAHVTWLFVLAPPFLSLVRASTHAIQRRLDFNLPQVIEDEPTNPFWMLATARSFTASAAPGAAAERAIDRIVRGSMLFHDRVRRDLQLGVKEALVELGREIPNRDPRGQALALVYRILFLLFAESRELVPVAHPIYGPSYAIGTLAREALRGASTGSWEALAAMTRLVRRGCHSRSLSVSAFGGRLFAEASAVALEERRRRRSTRQADDRDRALGMALVALSSRHGNAGRESISYHDLGVEELGAVYERLLDEPDRERPRQRSSATAPVARIRKLTGTFYTPQPLAEFIVRRTLAPLVRGASADNILALRILDPAMGSGACLIAACRYLASAYERALVDEGRAPASGFNERERADVRRLIGERCLAGVDRNPTAVELARLSLWLATLAHGKPLGFLDHRLRVGDSLIGAWPRDLQRVSMKPSSGEGSLPLFELLAGEHAVSSAGERVGTLLATRDDSIGDVRAKAAVWQSLVSSHSPLEPWRRALSFWCARWFLAGGASARPSGAESRAVIDALIGGDTTLPVARLRERLDTTRAVSDERRFFHWPLEFPDVFSAASGGRPSPGFDAVIGNPPWEMLRQDDGRDAADVRMLLGYIRESGLFPSCRHGHLNLYQAFLDRALSLVRPGGRVGMVLPWGLASDDGAAPLRRRLFDTTDVNSLVGLDNAEGLFPIHRGIRFLVFCATTGRPTVEVRARFGVTTSDELEELPEVDDQATGAYPVRLTRRKLERVGGRTLRIPDVRNESDLELADRLMAQLPSLGSSDGWGLAFGREANATEAAPWIGPRGIVVVEGKHISPFVVAPDSARRITRTAAERLVTGRPFDRWRLAYRDVSGVGNALTLIAALVPPDMVTTHTLLCLKNDVALERQYFLAACFNSWVLNAIVRLFMGGHVTTTLVENLPVPLWKAEPVDRWIAAASRRLSSGQPDEALHSRLQAAVARRYDLSAAEFDRVLDRAPLVSLTLRAAARDHFLRGDLAL